MRRSIALCSKMLKGPPLPRHNALRHPRIVAAGARASVSQQRRSEAQAQSETRSSAASAKNSKARPTRASRIDDDLDVPRPTRSRVCPCCFGAVHKPTPHSHLDLLSRPFSSMSTSTEASSATSSHQNIVQLILDDHNRARELFRQYGVATDKQQKERLARELIKMLSEHGAQEEMSVYPWMKSHDKSTVGMVDHGIEEHRDLKQAMYELDQLKEGADNPKFDQVVQKVWKSLSHHLEEEETSILPKLQQMATPKELNDLATKYNNVKIIAPSRPHPDAPSEGVAAVLANTGAAAVDKLRDVAREAKQSMSSENKQQ